MWRRLDKEATKKAMPPPPVAPGPAPAAALPVTASAAPAPAVTQAAAPQLPRLEMLETGDARASATFVNELKSSILVGKAIVAAFHLEGHVPWQVESESEGEESEEDSETDDEEDEAAELATVAYKHALRQLTRAYP